MDIMKIRDEISMKNKKLRMKNKKLRIKLRINYFYDKILSVL